MSNSSFVINNGRAGAGVVQLTRTLIVMVDVDAPPSWCLPPDDLDRGLEGSLTTKVTHVDVGDSVVVGLKLELKLEGSC